MDELDETVRMSLTSLECMRERSLATTNGDEAQWNETLIRDIFIVIDALTNL